ncbi:MAG: hypothetical protein F6K35_39120, partial [Okeania sp. SIO2H7]|nr:hypothetical protein [Okeania sp. SIO2H7]
MQNQLLKKPKFSLRSILIVPFLVQIVAAVSIVGYLSYRNGQKAVDRLAKELRSEVANRIAKKLDHYLSSPPLINRLNLQAVEIEELDLTATEAI